MAKEVVNSAERSYIHDQVSFQCQQVRIVTLLPGRDSTPLQCTIATVDLGSDELVYEALSYEWGDPASVREEISLNGQPFLVRKNLWSAMKHVRHTKTMRRLWIDAICINQDDLSERSHQVGMMGDIYRKAESVIVWLGEEIEDSRLAFLLLQQLEKGDWHVQILVDAGGVAGNGLASLLERPYWSRIWIVQEFLLARKLTVYCGFHHISAKNLEIARALCGPIDLLNPTMDDWDYWNYLTIRIGESPGMKLLDRRRNGLQQSIRDLLGACQGSKSSDPRDRIYALLGLASDVPKDAITVDYSRPVFKVIWDFLWFYQEKYSSDPKSVTQVCGLIDSMLGDSMGDDWPQASRHFRKANEEMTEMIRVRVLKHKRRRLDLFRAQIDDETKWSCSRFANHREEYLEYSWYREKWELEQKRVNDTKRQIGSSISALEREIVKLGS